jgi:hypothetical protein
MHNLALALHKGYSNGNCFISITFDKKGMLPLEMGWFPEKLQMILMQ